MGVPPINPGGPFVEITLKNVSAESVTSLQATLEAGRAFNFTFDVTSSSPLIPDKTISAKQSLIGGGYGDNVYYSLTITGTLKSGAFFAYTKQILIVSSSQ